MIDAIVTLLAADNTLENLLTGGIHNGATVGEISRQNTAAAFDANGEILPCALVQLESEVPFGEVRHGAQLFVQIFLYQRYGHGVINQAKDRIYTLLHRQKVGAPALGNYETWHANTLLGMHDPGLDCALVTCRYQCFLYRS